MPAHTIAPAAVTYGYCRVSTTHQSLAAQRDALVAEGVREAHIHSDRLTGTSTREQRPGLDKLLTDAQPGDVIVVVGIDRLGRCASEVMLTIKQLTDQGIVLKSLREGISTDNATGRMVAGEMASLAELELELGKERRAAARAARKSRGLHVGRPSALTPEKAALAKRMRDAGEPIPTIAATLQVSESTVYRAVRD
jgi:DNA invertase Pin-like site-specific DNA recombinase